MVFKKNNIPWNLGIPCSEEHKQYLKDISKTNPNFGMKGKKHRKYWIKFFQNLLSDRYGYNYNINNEIMIKC